MPKRPSKPGTANAPAQRDWKLVLVEGIFTIGHRLLDTRGPGWFFFFLNYLVIFGVLAILAIVFWRLPENEVGSTLRTLIDALRAGGVWYVLVLSVAANVVLAERLRSVRRIYKTETAREGDAKGELAKRIDPGLGSGHDLEGDG